MTLNSEAFKQDFIVECRDLLDRAESVILDIEQCVTSEGLNQLFRAVHTVKGNLSAYSGPGMIRLLHDLETLLNAYREGSSQPAQDDIDLILQAVDWVRNQLNLGLEATASNAELVDRLRQRMGRASSSAATRATGIADSESPNSEPSRKPAKLRIPRGLLESAAKDHLEVLIATIDISGQNCNSLSEYVDLCRKLEEKDCNLIQKIRTEEITDLNQNSALELDSCIPAYILLTAPSIDLDVFSGIGLRVDQKKFLQRSPANAVTANRPGNAVPLAQLRQSGEEATDYADQEGDPKGDESSGRESEDSSRAAKLENLRVPLRLIDNLIRLAGATVGARNELMQLIQSYEDPRLQLVGGRLGKMVTQMQEEIMLTRLQELQALFSRIPRVVRDVSKQSGKKVELEFSGADVELDKNLIDAIGEAIFHLVRNSIDHGIESPDVRTSLGKPESGKLSIGAEVRNGSVVLWISDDGKGLDLPALRNAAVRLGLYSAADAEALTEEEVAELIFHPGLSTAQNITNTSGRGVGMDAVRETFKSAGGSISVTSVPGRGTQFLATLPQTLSIVTCLTVSVSGRYYAIPQTGVEEVVLYQSELLEEAGSATVYQLRGRLIPLVRLGTLFDASTGVPPGDSFVVIVRTERQSYAIHVDSIGNTEEILVKPLGEHFRGNSLYSGAAVLGDGTVTPILDISGLARFAGVQFVHREQMEQTVEKEQNDVAGLYILFDIADQRFAIPAECSPRIEKYNEDICESMLGYPIARYNNRIVPILDLAFWCELEKRGEPEFLLLLKNEGEYLALASELIVGIQTSLPALESCDLHEAMAGQVILNNKTILVLDILALFRWRKARQRELNSRSHGSAGALSEAAKELTS